MCFATQFRAIPPTIRRLTESFLFDEWWILFIYRCYITYLLGIFVTWLFDLWMW